MASLFTEDELDEEQARRSIVVSNIPENVTDKDVFIHFQRGRNGGGEVDDVRYLNQNDCSAVVVTFEKPETVETAINQGQAISGVEVIVQRYPVPVVIPEVFEVVQATVNPRIFPSSDMERDVLQCLRDDFGVEFRHSRSRDVNYLTGSFKQIELCHEHLVDRFLQKPQDSQLPRRTSSRGTATDTSREEINQSENFQTVPVLLKFIFTVPKYSQQLHDIEQRCKVKISCENDGNKVRIKSMPGCVQKQFEEGREKFIDIYQKLHGGSMMLKELVLQLGSGSDFLTVDEAIDEVQHNVPVVIGRASAKDTWQFYGEDTDVQSAIHKVCKLLRIENPLKTSSRKRVPETAQNRKNEGTNNTPSDYKTMEMEEPQTPQDLARFQSASSVPDDSSGSPNSSDAFKEVFVTKKGFMLTVKLSDITEEKADAIVNCNDEHLTWSETIGLAKAIIDKGGHEIFHEAKAQTKRRKMKPGDIFDTSAGKLPCHKILHIILWNGKKGKETGKSIVQESVLQCLKRVQPEKMKSIAFPTVGVNHKTGMELTHCATAMVNAVEEYMKGSDPKKNAVWDIRFILYDQTAFGVFKTEVNKRYGDSRVTKPMTNAQSRPDNKRLAIPSSERKDDDSKKTHDNDKTDKQDDCAICLDTPSDPVTLDKCKHQFCRRCIEEAFRHKSKCPTCGVVYGVQTGNMPHGTMKHAFLNYRKLPGYERYGTIEINYHFPYGTQGPEHPNPGQFYSGTSRTAYLPDSPEGREVLGLLYKAFNARLTFTIGTSVTTGQQNTVTWNDIHHKTNTYGGATGFGYPDPDYLRRVKEELAAKGIS